MYTQRDKRVGGGWAGLDIGCCHLLHSFSELVLYKGTGTGWGE